MSAEISVVTPTYLRPQEMCDLIANLKQQSVLPGEFIVVDGADVEDTRTEKLISGMADDLPFRCVYLRHARGTAIQRNAGVERAQGNYVALIDDDIRLKSDFFAKILEAFHLPESQNVGAITGYRENQHFQLTDRQRWKWYRRLGLLRSFDPGKYDFETGYPINANMQPPFSGVREVDFVTTACTVWRKQVFDAGLRFDSFFRDFGILEDAHFSLHAAKRWKLLQCGDAHCSHLSSAEGRENRSKIGYKSVVNYYYVFNSVAYPLTGRQKRRFWQFQTFELGRIAASAIRRRRMSDVHELIGRLRGFAAVARRKAFDTSGTFVEPQDTITSTTEHKHEEPVGITR